MKNNKKVYLVELPKEDQDLILSRIEKSLLEDGYSKDEILEALDVAKDSKVADLL